MNITIEKRIKDGKSQCNINSIINSILLILVLSSGKIGKYGYLAGDILPSNQQRVIDQAKFTYFALGQASEKQVKIIEDERVKQRKSI